MRLIADTVLFAQDATPRFNAISIAGAHVRDAGSTAVEEMAYTLANGIAYVDELIRRGGDVERFAQRLSFFFYVHMDFFEEVAKFRAARRIWARLMQRALRGHRPEGPALPFRRRVRGLVADRPRSPTTTSCGWRSRRWQRSRAARSRSSPARSTRPSRSRPSSRPSSRCGRSRSSRMRAGSRGPLTRWAAATGWSTCTERTEEEILAVMAEIERYGGVVQRHRGRLAADAPGPPGPGAQAEDRRRQDGRRRPEPVPAAPTRTRRAVRCSGSTRTPAGT